MGTHVNREKPFRFGPFIFLVAIILCVRFGIEGCLNPRLTRLFNDGIKVVIDVYSNDFFFFMSQMVTRTKKIFVGGLSAPSTVDDVKNYFEQFGRVRENFWKSLVSFSFFQVPFV